MAHSNVRLRSASLANTHIALARAWRTIDAMTLDDMARRLRETRNLRAWCIRHGIPRRTAVRVMSEPDANPTARTLRAIEDALKKDARRAARKAGAPAVEKVATE